MPCQVPGIVGRIVAVLIPPACREEVLGDLSEVSTSPHEYILESVRVIPMVVFSRIRRTADLSLVLMEATALYLFFVGAALRGGDTSLFAESGLLRLAVPPAWVLFALILDDAYSIPGKGSIESRIRGPLLGLGLAYLSQTALSAGIHELALPSATMFYGSTAAVFFSAAVKAWFPIRARQIGTNVPALWLKQVSQPFRIGVEVLRVFTMLAAVLILGLVAGEVGGAFLAITCPCIGIVILILRELTRRH